MLAFHGDIKIKKKYVARVMKHRKLDHLIKGTGWEDGKGCAVGCTLEKYDHESYEKELGIPKVLAGLEDAIFEGLPNELAMFWPEEFLKAIKPGADLSRVWHHFCVWLLIDDKDGVFRFNNHESIRAVAELHAKAAAGNMPSIEAWTAASGAAWAAGDASRAAARAAAWAAAWAASRALAWASAREAAAWAAAYIKQSKKLLQLLKECK